MNTFTLHIAGKPVGKARPRVTMHGTYTPAKTKVYQHTIQLEFKQQVKNWLPLASTACIVEISVLVQTPERWNKQRRALALEGVIRPTVKPDLDNIAKSILDALNGLAWKDDAQVYKLTIEKRYAAANGCEVTVTAWESEVVETESQHFHNASTTP